MWSGSGPFLNFPQRLLRVLCGYFAHERRVMFENSVPGLFGAPTFGAHPSGPGPSWPSLSPYSDPALRLSVSLLRGLMQAVVQTLNHYLVRQVFACGLRPCQLVHLREIRINVHHLPHENSYAPPCTNHGSPAHLGHPRTWIRLVFCKTCRTKHLSRVKVFKKIKTNSPENKKPQRKEQNQDTQPMPILSKTSMCPPKNTQEAQTTKSCLDHLFAFLGAGERACLLVHCTTIFAPSRDQHVAGARCRASLLQVFREPFISAHT